MTRHPHCRRGAGFTLVEVLATLVLIGVVLPVAMEGVSRALASANTARHTAEAAQLGQAQLEQLVLTGEWATSGMSGNFGEQWPGYQWTVETATASSDYGLTEVRLWVRWMERGREQALNVSTWVLDSSAAASTGEVDTSTNTTGQEAE